jgi:hypothetical protein
MPGPETILFVAGVDSNKIACPATELAVRERPNPNIGKKVLAKRNRLIKFITMLVLPKVKNVLLLRPETAHENQHAFQ